jgi:single-stranded-DNA-specific exonuclease
MNVSPIIAQLLLNRQIDRAEHGRRFLDAPLSGLHAPALLPGLSEACERISAAVATKKRICIYGDYDVDGVTGTAILFGLLRRLGAAVEFYVPHRLEEGYGLNSAALRQRREAGVDVVVSVDCGIASLEEAREAKKIGLELIITDHHEMKDELPEAVLVHPRLPGSQYPFGGLSGAGVAFKLAWALAMKASGSEKVTPHLRTFLLDAVALAALGLVADVVPLQDENRILVRHGLARLKMEPPLGMKALIESAGLAANSTLRAEDIGFRLAPRMNAAGRLGYAGLVVEMLTTANAEKAKEVAEYLESQNAQRQNLERKMVQQAKDLLEGQDLSTLSAAVLAHPEWHPGVIGIVAGRMVEYLGRPVLMIAHKEGSSIATGSGRSIPGFALHEALRACDSELLGHGGHAMAAGFKVELERIEALRQCFSRYAAQHFPEGVPPAPRLILDAEVPLSALTVGLIKDLDKLEPYGAENPRPRFLAGGLQVIDPKAMGNGERHLSFRLKQGPTNLRGVAFSAAERLEELMSQGGHCCVAFTPKINEWMGQRRVEVEVVDFQPGPVARLV